MTSGCLRLFLTSLVFLFWGGGLVVLFFNLGWPLGAVLLAVGLFALPPLSLYWVASRHFGIVLWGGLVASLVGCIALLVVAGLVAQRSH